MPTCIDVDSSPRKIFGQFGTFRLIISLNSTMQEVVMPPSLQSCLKRDIGDERCELGPLPARYLLISISLRRMTAEDSEHA